jgi:transcriptional regulator with XRE-family HTH domain
MAENNLSFGEYISKVRKSMNKSQKELAIELGISPQYLNDIEHDKRTPSSSLLIDNLAMNLKLRSEYLYYLAGRMPEDFKRKKLDEESFNKAWVAFRGVITPKTK